MKLLQFGTIKEDDEGRIVLSNFHCDCEGYTGLDCRTCLVDLVIERLKQAKAEIQGDWRASTVPWYKRSWWNLVAWWDGVIR